MKISAELQALEGRIGYKFKDPALLLTAITHSSINTTNRSNNERLEFLGDRVLGLAMATALLDADKNATEGQLAPRFNALVRKETCADVARAIHLGDALKLGRSEMKSGGRRKDALLGNAMEAVIGAVYRDGGYGEAENLVFRLWGDRVTTVKEDARDPKTSLQEWAQARKLPPPTYELIERTGPDHAPEFVIQAKLQSGPYARAKAGSKRAAEQAAARELLQNVEQAS